MSDVVLVYPYSRPHVDRSTFRFPPLGPAYVAAGLRQAGHAVSILDCTFLDDSEVQRRVAHLKPEVVGVYSMVTMRESALRMARMLKGKAGKLVVGGPLPSAQPELFLGDYDVVVRGEGEATVLELVNAFARDGRRPGLSRIPGITYLRSDGGKVAKNPARAPAPVLDDICFPARDLLPNELYKADGRRRHGSSITSIITSRGCPYECEFCSNPVFGRSYRKRSAGNVVEEVEQVLALGYERVHFADDVFTLDRRRLMDICSEIWNRGLVFDWECLARVDSIDREVADAMRSAGCYRVFFGIESGVDEVLALMGKSTTREQIQRGVEAAAGAGLQAGGFFIACYPGDTDSTVLETLRFASHLPLKYASFTMPYPLPGTGLYERVGGNTSEYVQSGGLVDHSRIYKGDFSATKMKFAILKGRAQFYLRQRHGGIGKMGAVLFEKATDGVFRAMR
jgi:anaerobic magnesium-protoporphyrin IX monomethyl ester cyclase